jgi:hypothetical protein
MASRRVKRPQIYHRPLEIPNPIRKNRPVPGTIRFCLGRHREPEKSQAIASCKRARTPPPAIKILFALFEDTFPLYFA